MVRDRLAKVDRRPFQPAGLAPPCAATMSWTAPAATGYRATHSPAASNRRRERRRLPKRRACRDGGDDPRNRDDARSPRVLAKPTGSASRRSWLRGRGYSQGQAESAVSSRGVRQRRDAVYDALGHGPSGVMRRMSRSPRHRPSFCPIACTDTSEASSVVTMRRPCSGSGRSCISSSWEGARLDAEYFNRCRHAILDLDRRLDRLVSAGTIPTGTWLQDLVKIALVPSLPCARPKSSHPGG